MAGEADAGLRLSEARLAFLMALRITVGCVKSEPLSSHVSTLDLIWHQSTTASNSKNNNVWVDIKQFFRSIS
jgi:hypothetical protein